MSLITLFEVCIIAGIALYLVNVYIPMDAKIKQILNIGVVIILLLWILQGFVGPLGL